jgi:hypothetical protein
MLLCPIQENIEFEMKRRQMRVMDECHKSSNIKIKSIQQTSRLLKLVTKLFIEKWVSCKDTCHIQTGKETTANYLQESFLLKSHFSKAGRPYRHSPIWSLTTTTKPTHQKSYVHAYRGLRPWRQYLSYRQYSNSRYVTCQLSMSSTVTQ